MCASTQADRRERDSSDLVLSDMKCSQQSSSELDIVSGDVHREVYPSLSNTVLPVYSLKVHSACLTLFLQRSHWLS